MKKYNKKRIGMSILSFFLTLFMIPMFILSSPPSFAMASSKESVEKHESSIPEGLHPVEVLYFWGDGCSHCEKLEPWLNSFELMNPDAVTIKKFEIWKNRENAMKFDELMATYGVKEEDQGTPTVIVNHKVISGDTDIASKLPQEVENALKEQQKKLVAQLEAEAQGKSVGTGFFPQIDPPSDESLKKKNVDSMTLRAIFLAAIADSINPCAIMVLIILLSSLIVYQKDNKKKIILTAFAFILAVYLTYFLIGLGLASIVATAKISNTITMIVGVIAIIIGLANIKDAFFYRKGDWAIEIPQAWRTKLTKILLRVTSPVGAFLSGGIVTMFELPCTGGPYLFGISLISHASSLGERIALLGFYNLVFILPLIIIAILVVKGTMTIEKAENMRNRNVKMMHMITGLIMLAVGIWAVFLK